MKRILSILFTIFLVAIIASLTSLNAFAYDANDFKVVEVKTLEELQNTAKTKNGPVIIKIKDLIDITSPIIFDNGSDPIIVDLSNGTLLIRNEVDVAKGNNILFTNGKLSFDTNKDLRVTPQLFAYEDSFLTFSNISISSMLSIDKNYNNSNPTIVFSYGTIAIFNKVSTTHTGKIMSSYVITDKLSSLDTVDQIRLAGKNIANILNSGLSYDNYAIITAFANGTFPLPKAEDGMQYKYINEDNKTYTNFNEIKNTVELFAVKDTSSQINVGTVITNEPIWGVVIVALLVAAFAGGIAIGNSKKKTELS